IEKVLSVAPASRPVMGVAAGSGATWFRIAGERAQGNGWDRAHEMVVVRGELGLAAADEVLAAEPDLEQGWVFQPPSEGRRFAAVTSVPCTFEPQDGREGRAVGPAPGWSTGDEFSQLSKAAARVSEAKQKNVVVAHLDTGFDPNHSTRPANLDL